MSTKYPGKLITFEGIDGCGKTTQAEILRDYLAEKGKKVWLTCEPSKDTKVGTKIRDLILNYEINDAARFFLFLADRANHVKEIIYPMLEDGYFVICDRFVHSTFAYQHKIIELMQGYNIYTKERVIDHFINFASLSIKPDLTLLIDIDPSVSKERMRLSEKHKDDFDHMDINSIEEIRRIFIKICSLNKKRFHIFNGDTTPEKLHKMIIETVGYALL